MAAEYTASTSRIAVAAATSINNLQNASICAWVWVDTFPVLITYLFHKKPADNHFLRFYGTGTGLEYLFSRATTDQTVYSVLTNFAHWGTGKWVFIASTADNTTDANNKLYMGDLTNPPTEPSSYGGQQAGSGTFSDESAVVLNIGQNGANQAYLDGRLGPYYVFNTTLSAVQVYQVWRSAGLGIGGNVLHFEPGWTGVSSIVDYSGHGNTGTGTTISQVAHPGVLNPFAWHRAARGIDGAVAATTTDPGITSPYGWFA